jgi:phosphopentomutase
MRALIIVLDGVGVGGAPDAAKYNDAGANTLGHLFVHYPKLDLPVLFSLGLGEILGGNVHMAEGTKFATGYGRMQKKSPGKDTITGLWEIAGVVTDEPFAIFKKFPESLVRQIEAAAKVEFIGNYAQSGPTVLDELGQEHLKTGKPILYASADSVMQIAAHEKIMPRKRLYEICRHARTYCNAHRIGRVIARPFTGKPGKFTRAEGRHDYTLVPPRSILNAISETGLVVEGVGRISSLFARSGVTHHHATKSNEEALRAIERLWRRPRFDGLIFAGLADFDMVHAPARDLKGFSDALMQFDTWLGVFLDEIEPEDLVIITAGHGHDPVAPFPGHTREEVPLIARYDGKAGPLGVRQSFADIAATLGSFFHLKEIWPVGEPLFKFPRGGKRL